MSVMLKNKEIPKQAAWKKASKVSFDAANATTFKSCFEGAAVNNKEIAKTIAKIFMKKLVLRTVMMSIHPKNKNVDTNSGAKEIIKPFINDLCGKSPVDIDPWGPMLNPLELLHISYSRWGG